MRRLLELRDEILTWDSLRNQSDSYVISTRISVVVHRVPCRFNKFQAFFVAVFLPPDVRSKMLDAYLLIVENAIVDKAVGSGDDILDVWHIFHENTRPA